MEGSGGVDDPYRTSASQWTFNATDNRLEYDDTSDAFVYEFNSSMANSFIANKVYKVKFTIGGLTSGVARLKILAGDLAYNFVDDNTVGYANGTHNVYFTTTESGSDSNGFAIQGLNSSGSSWYFTELSFKPVQGHVGTMTNQDSADLVYSSVLPDQSFLTGVNSAYNFIDLDGSNEYIQLTGNSPANSFTISAWVFDTHASGGDYSAIYSANNVTIWFGVRNNSSGFVRLHINGSPHVDTPSGSFSSPSNQWLHLVGSWDGTNAKIYINGVSQTLTTSGTPSNPSAQANPTIGINDSNFGLNQWTGYLANVAVWDKALSDDDTLAIYNSGRHYNLLDSYSDNMISYHTMGLLDAKTGLSDVGDGTIYDRSGNSNHGTATNSESADLKSSPNAQPEGYAKQDVNRSTTTP